MEVWKDIKGFEGLYQISNLGRVRSLDRPVKQRGNSIQIKKGKIIVQSKNHKGYPTTNMSKGNKRYGRPTHRLVAETFIPNPENKDQVNHIDGDKLNNSVENLEWMTGKENIRHAIENGLMKFDVKIAKHASNVARERNKKIVSQYDLDGNYISTFGSLIEAEEKTGVTRKGISEVACGRQKTAGGYAWKYPEEAIKIVTGG